MGLIEVLTVDSCPRFSLLQPAHRNLPNWHRLSLLLPFEMRAKEALQKFASWSHVRESMTLMLNCPFSVSHLLSKPW
jgi:hypothetical protein